MIRHPFNDDWYVRSEGGGGSDAAIGPVTVPYDAMMFEQRDPATPNSQNTGFFPGGVYRYSKTFRVPADHRGRSITIEFEGVYMRSEVFVNGRLAGGRPSGYAIFTIELDDYLQYDADNLIEVVAHNDGEPNSRWYTGSGIYRPVHLLVGDRVRVTPNGLRVTTQAATPSMATIEISTQIVNDSTESRAVTLTARVTDWSRTADGLATEQVDLDAGATTTISQLVSVSEPGLWSPDSPTLYTVAVQLTDGDRVVDEAVTDFGIRTLAVDARLGLRINGTPVKLRGACIHHDNGVIGAHTLEAAEDRRIRLLKESGYNAVRSAHNPASRATLRACDRHGVLVMDELTDVWWRPKSNHDYSAEFETWWEQDLESLIAKDANHPSVIMYAIGNEIAETATPRGIRLNRAIAQRSRELDSTRFVTNAINGFLNLISPMQEKKTKPSTEDADAGGSDPGKNLIFILNYLMGALDAALKYIVRLPAVDKRTRDAFADVDIAGYNYMRGRYRPDGRHHPHRVIVGSETSPSETAAIWREIENSPQVIGDFAWTGWDYIGEAGIAVILYNQRRQLFQPYPGLLAGEPVIDITGHRQTQSYLNEIIWHLQTGPLLAVQPVNHSGEKRSANGFRSTNSLQSWSWEGNEGRIATVEVYADADRVELLLNGARVGSSTLALKDDYLATFSVPYQPGELTAVSYGKDGAEIGRTSLATAGSELGLNVRAETEAIVADGADLAYIPIELTDAAGVVRPLTDRMITLEVNGPGTLLGFGSAEPITEEQFSTNQHTTYWGRALAVIRAGHEAGEVSVTARAEGCEPVTLIIPVLPFDPDPSR